MGRAIQKGDGGRGQSGGNTCSRPLSTREIRSPPLPPPVVGVNAEDRQIKKEEVVGGGEIGGKKGEGGREGGQMMIRAGLKQLSGPRDRRRVSSWHEPDARASVTGSVVRSDRECSLFLRTPTI